jgi:hypothetical protein
MIKKFEEFVNEGLLDIFSGDGCKNLETICSAFAKRLSSVAPIKFEQKLSDGKIIERELNYSEMLRLQYISADDNLVVDNKGKRTIKEEARRIAKQFEKEVFASEYWGSEEKCFKHLTKYLYKTGDLDVFDNADTDTEKSFAIFTFTIPYLEPMEDEDEKDLYELKMYYYTTRASCKTYGKDDKETAIHLLNTAFYRLYKGLTDPDDKVVEYTDSTDTTFKDIRKFIPTELIDVVKKATKRGDLK